ncbi:ATP-binding cassette domain-containing protein [Shewanella sp. Isolate11]|uniref:peptidase domain-containing ABC transporter n=1 Tax=Shewanella sp. Isolate11 TaxID=2908530 RepID=UPI001EFE193F|nr:ATP-binding cassette domain-containing protein [Shewanella sp. Isolate11]MCG9695572.1 ATP-binding cassette domain-containing protein [Shewanella sp. Isolate11]
MDSALNQSHCPKSLLVNLFKQLGLSVQASNIESGDLKESLSHLEIYILLKKHHVAINVHTLDKNLLIHTVYPFILLPETGEPCVARRSEQKFQYLAENGKWEALETLPTDGRVFIIESLPSADKKVSLFTSHLKKRKKWFKPIFWLSLLSSVTGLAIPIFTMVVYDRVIGGQAPNILPEIALGAILALAIFISSRLIRAYMVSVASNRFARDLSGITFNRLLSMPLTILSRVGVYNHLSRLRNAEKVRTLISGPGGAGLIDLPFTLIALITIAALSGWLVLVPLVMLLLFYLIMKGLNKFTQSAAPKIGTEYQNSLSELSRNLLDLKKAGDTEGWYTQFLRRTKENSRQNFLYAQRSGLQQAVAHAMGLLTALATVFSGIFLVLNQTISSGALIACVMLIWRITGPAQMAFSSRQKLSMMDNSVKQFDRFMEVTTEFNDLRLDIPNMDKAPAISVKHLTLRYSADTESALSGVSFDVEPGEIVAIIGPNGCGKTSLLLSTIGLIDAQAGYVTINGKNLKQYDPEAFRQWVGYGSDASELLPGTIADNLRLAKPNATDKELRQAIIDAGGEHFLQTLDNDIDTEVLSNKDNMFSGIEGGYRGYLSLTRALLKQSKLLVIDEPIANRNPSSKKAFIETLKKLKGNTTILFTSHDQELIQQADKVVILDKGAVVYAGPIPNQEAENADVPATSIPETSK